jgi:hypothetical protein
MQTALPEPIQLTGRAVAEMLGRHYRHGRILRRLLRLIEEAEKQGLLLTTADRLLAAASVEPSGLPRPRP